jgi:hypothetical protein
MPTPIAHEPSPEGIAKEVMDLVGYRQNPR